MVEHTIRKVRFLSRNSILTKPQHFHELFTQIFFWQFFSWNPSCQQLKSPKPQHFHEFSPKKIDNFLGKSKLNFWTKNEDFEHLRYFIYISTLSLHVGQLDIFQDCGSGACYNFPIWNKNASIIYPFLIIISFGYPPVFQFYSNISWACHSSESQRRIFGALFHGLENFELTIYK